MSYWHEQSVFYQIYPLGFCGAPQQNDGVLSHRLLKLLDWIPQIQKCGADAVYFCPLFESDAHGYDTRDYRRVDCRLGDNGDLKKLVQTYHENGISVVFDGVFNHVGRGFWAFADVLKNRESSQYKDWFMINFSGDDAYHDGLWYEGWEGHYELVKLNLSNPEVRRYLLDCVGYWMDEFGVDGLRLDVAYLLDRGFMRELRSFCQAKREDFFLVGEMLHGDYNQLTSPDLLHSVTNYECYKGLYSSFNSMNLFEIGFSLNRQFGPEYWTLYKGKHLLCFADNHDVTRVASVLTDRNHLVPLYGLLFGMPGIPCIYYGSEWGEEGEKKNGDALLRPAIDAPKESALTAFIAKCAAAHRENPALWRGDYRQVFLTNRQLVFSRCADGKRVFVAVNADKEPFAAHFSGCPKAKGLISGAEIENLGSGTVLAPYSAEYWEEM